jgi:hypothetical protein
MDEFVRRPKRSPLKALESDELTEPAYKKPEPLQQEPDPFMPRLPAVASRRKFRLHLPRPKTRVQWGITIGSLAGLLIGSGLLIYWYIIRDTSPPPITYTPPVVQEPEPEPEPTTVASRLSGRQIDKANAIKPIYAVQIENSPEARPQSGLRDADIVSEAVAEGGITRFNAIFHDNVPANIGPVRSLRPYYIDWFLPYGAPIVHAGGSAEALNDIRVLGLQDIDNTKNYFRRVSNRYAPHNLYTTGGQMLELFAARGYKNADPIPSLPRKEPAPTTAPTASTINLAISSTLYNVSLSWDSTTNTYLRKQGGTNHVDAESGQQLAPNVVVVPIMKKGIHPDRVHTQYGTVGGGEVFVFQDGTVTKGTWSKASRAAQWQLTDASGNPITLNPGQTWFTMMDAASKVTYQ